MDHLELAKAAMRFIDTRKQKGPSGAFWSVEDAAAGKPIYYDEISLYAGASGILLFLLGLFDATGEKAYLEEAEDAADYLRYRWECHRKLKRNFSPYAFSSGWAGAGFAAAHLFLVCKKEAYRALACSIAEQAIEDAAPSPDGIGYSWSSYPGIVGDAGTILFLLFAADTFHSEKFRSFAISAGRAYLSRSRDMGGGKKAYLGVNPAYFGASEDYIDPNFPMGTCGVGYLLLKLYEASGDEAFFQAVKGVPEYVSSVAVRQKRGKLLPHGLPDRPDLFYLGYCHGPAGTVRFFYKLWEMTGNAAYQEAIQSLVQGLEDTGAPRLRSAGYWNNYNLCCGTAGILNMYLGLWASSKDPAFLAQARACAEVLTEGAQLERLPEGPAAKWPLALDRIAPDVCTTPVGCMDGAAGIGIALLQMARAERGDFHVRRFLDDPFPTHA